MQKIRLLPGPVCVEGVMEKQGSGSQMLPSEIKLPVGVESMKWLSHRPGNRLLRSGNGSYSQQEELVVVIF